MWCALSLEDRKAAGYGGNDDADLINVISAIENHKVGMILIEQHDNNIKVSWRALEKGVDVSTVATHFGGGGHAAAAGAMITGALSKVQSSVLEKTKELLRH